MNSGSKVLLFPYTVAPGDTMGAVALRFNISVDELAHANRMHSDDELLAGAVLKIPNPFTAEVVGLRSQVDSLNADAQSAERKAQAVQDRANILQQQVQELSANNQELTRGLRILPWWRATALSIGVLALLMFGVMVVTLFEWWRMRRRFVVLADLTDSLGRLDQKYKEMLAKAELRLQQLYGRRRPGMGEGQQLRAKMPEEIELERLNEELKEILQIHLERIGARARTRRRARWRELIANDPPPVEAPSARR